MENNYLGSAVDFGQEFTQGSSQVANQNFGQNSAIFGGGPEEQLHEKWFKKHKVAVIVSTILLVLVIIVSIVLALVLNQKKTDEPVEIVDANSVNALDDAVAKVFDTELDGRSFVTKCSISSLENMAKNEFQLQCGARDTMYGYINDHLIGDEYVVALVRFGDSHIDGENAENFELYGMSFEDNGGEYRLIGIEKY